MSCLAELFVTQMPESKRKLDKIHDIVRWKRFEYRLEKILNRSGLGPTGYPPLNLFKILVLQNLYGLSDPDMEYMLYDRLTFRKFCGFGLTDRLPDETTICRFRSALQSHTEKLLSMVNQDIESHGIHTKSGTIIDATVIESSVRPPAGGTASEKDPEAGWTKKGGKFIHGYKAHVASDAKVGLIRRVKATSADVHDSQVFEQLLTGDEPFVTADKAYDSKKHRNLLKQHGIEDKLLYKGKRNQKIARWQVELNKLYSKTRCNIERIFAHWKVHMRLNRSRYKGWGKHQVHFDLISIAYNLKRAAKILAT
ncbi:MAG: IS5 family transposase [Alphaproteobacteria bacterium]|jgi:transposase, IS5 family|nr:IS5 family transposase [Alphaproteobacteria bacterium]